MMLYSWLSMVMRACLVALDWNDSIDRRHKALETGELMYREKVLYNYTHILSFRIYLVQSL